MSRFSKFLRRPALVTALAMLAGAGLTPDARADTAGADASTPRDRLLAAHPGPGWIEAPGTRIPLLPRSDLPLDGKGQARASHVIGWNGMAFPNDGKAWLCASGGHGDYAGNECHSFDLRRLAWALETLPNDLLPRDGDHDNDGIPNARETPWPLAPTTSVDAGGPVSYPAPASRHTYAGPCAFHNDRHVYIMPGSVWGNGKMAGGFWRFDPKAPADRAWAQLAARDPGGVVNCQPDPTNDQRVFLIGRKRIWTMDRDGRRLRVAARDFRASRIDPAFRTDTGALYWKDGAGIHKLTRVSVAEVCPGALDFAGDGDPAIHRAATVAQSAGMEWANGELWFWDGNANMVSLDPDSCAVREHPHATGPDPLACGQSVRNCRKFGARVFSKFKWLPDAGVFFAYSQYDANVWFYRPAP